MSREGAPGPSIVALDPSIAESLRAELPQVASLTVAAVVAEVPEYADPLRGELGANITRAVELALATFLHLAEEPPSDDHGDRMLPALEAAYALGRGEARSGRTMNALLAADRVGARVAWQRWGAAAVDAGLAPQLMVGFAALVFAYIDQLSAASVSGHSDEVATSGRVREQYLERLAVALVTGASAEELEQRAERAGWTPPRTLTCLVGPAAHTGALRSQLHPATLSLSADVLEHDTPEETTLHLVPDVRGARASLVDRVAGRAWTVGPERPWTCAAASARRAIRAVPLHRSQAVVDTEQCLADLVLTADSEAGADLRTHVLAPLADMKSDSVERLAQTLLTWILHQGRRDDVARHLHVHPQTVRYRMGQIRQHYGERLNDPRFVRDLIVGLGTTTSA